MKAPAIGTPIQFNRVYNHEGPFLGIVIGHCGHFFYVKWVAADPRVYYQANELYGDIIINVDRADECFDWVVPNETV